MTPKRSGNKTKDWFVYILHCGNGALYTGVTTDVRRRIKEHKQNGRRSARFTRAFAPVELVYSCRVGAKNLAYRIEYHIKKLPRSKKAIVVANNFSNESLMTFLKLEP
jgi:putative endonuclease